METGLRAVLGIDAAWTVKNPSGVAVVVDGPAGWHLLAAYSSYEDFFAVENSKGPSLAGPREEPGASDFIDQVQKLCSYRPAIVAIDMPLSRQPITKRRASDDAISRRYGRQHAGTHTPSQLRPGPLSDRLRLGFETAGYPLLTLSKEMPGLIEVYPHPALIELTGAKTRRPYKVGKMRAYWPTASRLDRRTCLLHVWDEIVSCLEKEISGIAARLPNVSPVSNLVALKAYEDTLDAVICAWVGVRVLGGRANAFGDGDSAIWVPTRET